MKSRPIQPPTHWCQIINNMFLRPFKFWRRILFLMEKRKYYHVCPNLSCDILKFKLWKSLFLWWYLHNAQLTKKLIVLFKLWCLSKISSAIFKFNFQCTSNSLLCWQYFHNIQQTKWTHQVHFSAPARNFYD